MLTHERLLEVLAYDTSTGIFTWKVNQSKKGPQIIGRVAGSLTHNGYIQICVDQRSYLAHRLAWFYVHGYWAPRNDHKDQNKKNNALGNLRNATQSQNMANVGKRKNNTSGFKGVCMHKASGLFMATIKQNYKTVYAAYFKTAQAAHDARCAKARELFGEFDAT